MSVAETYPKVQGRCPACGASSLFLGDGGYVTCAILGCGDPTASSRALNVPEVHVMGDELTAEDGPLLSDLIRTAQDRLSCDRPPEGWRCTRGRGHDGPCAAWPEVAASRAEDSR